MTWLPHEVLLGLEPCDCLMVAAEARDAALACPERIRSEVAAGRRVLVLSLFEAADDPSVWHSRARECLGRLGAGVRSLGLPNARTRRGVRSYREAAVGRRPEDVAVLTDMVRLVHDAAAATRARDVYGPLGVGGHIDRRLAQEAVVAALCDEAGRNLFLYEDRPEALKPGSVYTCLGQMGARLPPGARTAAARKGALRAALGASWAARMRGEPVSLRERLMLAAPAFGDSRRARVWNPAKALGPRLQPIVPRQAGDHDAMVRGVAARLLPDPKGRGRVTQHFLAGAHAHARHLGGNGWVERLWLVLPERDGIEPAVLGAEVRAAV
jgi:hypothetical protein